MAKSMVKRKSSEDLRERRVSIFRRRLPVAMSSQGARVEMASSRALAGWKTRYGPAERRF